MTTIERSWIQKHLGMANDEKQWLARYAASHLVGYGDVIFVDSGTSLTALMIEIIKRQAEGEKLDLQVVTSNLQVIAMGRSMPPAAGSNEDDSGSVPSAASSKDDESGYLGPGFLEAFKATQIVLTGGHVNPSLDSLTGEHAVSGIKEPLFHPTTVFFGARGLSFRPELVITYQFLD